MLNFGESLSTGIRDSEANDLERPAASLGCLALRCCEASADKVGEHSACESVGAQQRLGEPTLMHGEQFHRPACCRGEAGLAPQPFHARTPCEYSSRSARMRQPTCAALRAASVFAVSLTCTASA